ncbi:MAG TPA: hypothetical protein PKC21_07840 [Oligoflexia bacterium]|nr:hypothetical protein [Oligoflexia bacterium]HMR25249.1 hypothetical protein [Oligoflexia bacterium]
MKTFILLLLSWVCITYSQVPGPNGQAIDIFLEQQDKLKPDAQFSDFLFFLSFPTDTGYEHHGLIIWQLNYFDDSMSLKTLPGYYIQNPVTRIYYKLSIQIDSREIPAENYPDMLQFLEKTLFDNPNFELKLDQEGTLKITPLPTQ